MPLLNPKTIIVKAKQNADFGFINLSNKSVEKQEQKTLKTPKDPKFHGESYGFWNF